MGARRKHCSVIAYLVLAAGLVAPAAALAQTPQQLREQYLRALQFRQMAAQQMMYPTPVSPYAAQVNYLQYFHSLESLRNPNLAPLPAQIQAIQQRAQAMQFRMYPQLLSPTTYPLNTLEVGASRRAGLNVPIPQPLPVGSDAFVATFAYQEGTVDTHIQSTTYAMRALQGPAATPMQGFAAAIQGMAARAARPAAGRGAARAGGRLAVANRELNALMFRELPGERELELAWIWKNVNPEKARELFQRAETRAGPDTPVAKLARKQLDAMDKP